MAYMVLEINTVLPEDTSKLAILPEHDVCTLVTCTPYGVNTHRLMVRGTRIRNDQAEYVENLKAERDEREGVTQSTPFSSVRMVGKKRKTTSSPRMNGVGIRRRDKNAESIPGGVVIRSQDTRKIGDRFQNIRT